MKQENVQNVETTNVETTENTETQTAEEKVEKTFATQEEFNEALKKEVARKTQKNRNFRKTTCLCRKQISSCKCWCRFQISKVCFK